MTAIEGSNRTVRGANLSCHCLVVKEISDPQGQGSDVIVSQNVSAFDLQLLWIKSWHHANRRLGVGQVVKHLQVRTFRKCGTSKVR